MQDDTAKPATEQRLRFARAILGTRRAQTLLPAARALPQLGWDVLTKLYCAEQAGELIDVDQLAAALDMSRATLQRWLRALAAERLIEPAWGGIQRLRTPRLTGLAATTLTSLLDAGLDELQQ